MNQPQDSAYGLWSLVIINSLIFIIFAFSFAKPKSPRDWRSFGDEYRRYTARVPAFIPRLSSSRPEKRIM